MSSLLKCLSVNRLSGKQHVTLMTVIRHHWNKDYKPAAYPRTEEERRRAAEKYGLHPDEYQPYPDDGSGCGDYPKLPEVGADTKDPYYPWDNPELKRNFNEPLHADFDLMREDRYNVSARLRYSVRYQWFQFLAVMFGTFGLYYFFECFKMFHPLTPRQYPGGEQKHYTFDQE